MIQAITEKFANTMGNDSSAGSMTPYTAEWHRSLEEILGPEVCRSLDIYAIPTDLYLSVVVPVYNECATLTAIVQRIKDVPITKEILLVDDGSKDGSRDLIQRLAEDHEDDGRNTIRVILHEKNRGKGAAVRTGFAEAKGSIVLIQDADLECNPAEYPRLLRPIVQQQADVVYGSRFLGGKGNHVVGFWRHTANKFLTSLSNLFNDIHLTDMETCYKVFRREVLEQIGPELKQERFGIEPEITARVARHRYRMYEVPISYQGRTVKQGKKISWRDGLAAIWYIVRYGLAK